MPNLNIQYTYGFTGMCIGFFFFFLTSRCFDCIDCHHGQAPKGEKNLLFACKILNLLSENTEIWLGQREIWYWERLVIFIISARLKVLVLGGATLWCLAWSHSWLLATNIIQKHNDINNTSTTDYLWTVTLLCLVIMKRALY